MPTAHLANGQQVMYACIAICTRYGWGYAASTFSSCRSATGQPSQDTCADRVGACTLHFHKSLRTHIEFITVHTLCKSVCRQAANTLPVDRGRMISSAIPFLLPFLLSTMNIMTLMCRHVDIQSSVIAFPLIQRYRACAPCKAYAYCSTTHQPSRLFPFRKVAGLHVFWYFKLHQTIFAALCGDRSYFTVGLFHDGS